MSEQTFERRGRHDIIMQILKSAINGAKKTHIMMRARINFTQFEKYLNHLSEAGFVAEEDGIWRTTEKGLHAIEACRICLRLMKEVR